MTVERKTYVLEPHESHTFMHIRTGQNAEKVWDFWREVAEARGLDYRSIIGSELTQGTFTALPSDHGKHWCFPIPLKCARKPPHVERND